jgi:pimeloyl-ACP methyl ester carboxylesterase
LAAAVVAGPAPRDAAGLDWSAGMAQENIEEFGLAEIGGEEFETYLETMASGVQALATPADAAAGLGDLVTDKDREAIVSGGVGDYFIAAFRQATLTGADGWRDDDRAFVADWGVELSTIAKPVLIWHGSEDRMVPATHGEWLADRIPGAELRRAHGEGHVSLAPEALPDVLDFLAKAAGI